MLPIPVLVVEVVLLQTGAGGKEACFVCSKHMQHCQLANSN
jgi:hypothetical protein